MARQGIANLGRHLGTQIHDPKSTLNGLGSDKPQWEDLFCPVRVTDSRSDSNEHLRWSPTWGGLRT